MKKAFNYICFVLILTFAFLSMDYLMYSLIISNKQAFAYCAVILICMFAYKIDSIGVKNKLFNKILFHISILAIFILAYFLSKPLIQMLSQS